MKTLSRPSSLHDLIERAGGFPRRPASVLLIATNVRRDPQSAPFDEPSTTDSYENLAVQCETLGLHLWLTHCANLRSEHTALAWRRQRGRWRPAPCDLAEIDLAYADLPPSFPEARAFERALRSHSIPVVNDLRFSECATDKILTHELFPDHVPKTWSAAEPDLERVVRRTALHTDLDATRLFLKPRFGERGRGIYLVDPPGLSTHPAIGRRDYIVQPFLETGAGIPELGIRERHDLRLIVCDGRIELAFARLPEAGSYLSNYSQGGRELPLDPEALPPRLTDLAHRVDERLSHLGPRLYSLDIGIGHSGKIWIFELNTMPGIAWDDRMPENRHLHESMHRLVARWLYATWLDLRSIAEVFEPSDLATEGEKSS